MIKEKNAVVTGARRGIGRAVVEAFARNGANIWACVRTKDLCFEDEMAALSKKCGVWIETVYFDLADDEQIKAGVRQIQKKKLPVDVLVNNAGMISESTSFLMTSMTKLKEIFQVNFFAQIMLTQYISRLMIRQKLGVIINISSIAALNGEPGQLEYVCSKAAMIGATKKLSIELGEYNIRVNTVAPGIIDTEMGNRVQEQLLEKILAKSIMQRKGSPEEIADTVAFLSSDKASYITGQIVCVDGGLRI